MNGSLNSINNYFKIFFSELKNKSSEIIFAVPFVFLNYIKNFAIRGYDIEIFAQNCHQEEYGAFTGEVSANMLLNIGINGSIIGHCERRQYGENYKIVNQKLKVLIKNDQNAIVCFGEDDKNKKYETISEQVKTCLNDIEKIDNIIFAYEPVWAIGKENDLDLDYIDDSIQKMRDVLSELKFENVNIIYGGSVNLKNYIQILSNPNIDGILVGRESLDPFRFAKICNFNVQD